MKNSHILHLDKGQIFSGHKHDMEIRCLDGILWITQPGDGRDVILSKGQSFMAKKAHGHLVVEAIKSAQLEVKGMAPQICFVPVHSLN
jgi:Protein of unknown function (DUF2917).